MEVGGEAPAVLDACQPPNVVDGQLDVIARAAFKRDLELSTKILVVLVANKKAEQGLRIRQYIERLRRGRSRPVTASDVADSVAACFARGNPGFRQKAQ